MIHLFRMTDRDKEYDPNRVFLRLIIKFDFFYCYLVALKMKRKIKKNEGS